MKTRWIVAIIVVLALGAVCVGLGAVAFFSYRSFSSQPLIQVGPVMDTGVTSSATEQLSFDVSGQAMLDVETPFGDITVTGGEGSQIQVTAEKITHAANQELADQALADLKVVMTQEGNRVTLRVEQPNIDRLRLEPYSSEVDFNITVPTTTTTVLRTRSGVLELSGTSGKTDLSSDFGEIQITDFTGGLAAASKSGRVSARNIGLLETTSEGLVGDVSLQSDFGEIVLEDCQTQRVTTYSRSGAVTLTNVKAEGAVSLKSDYGRLTFQVGNAGSLEADTRSGQVDLKDLVVAGQVTAHSDFGNLDLRKVEAEGYDLSSSSGGIEADGTSGPVKAESGFGDVVISAAQDAVLNLKTSSGKVEFRGSLGSGDHHVQTDFGAVRLVLPARTALDVDLSTGFGSIRSDFDVDIDGEPDESHWRGTLNGGGDLLTAVTKNGQIQLVMGE